MDGQAVGLTLQGDLHGPEQPLEAVLHLTAHGVHIGLHSPTDGEEEGHDVVLTVEVIGLVKMEVVDLLYHEEKQQAEDLDLLATAMEAPSQDGRWETQVDDRTPLARFEIRLLEEVRPCFDSPEPLSPG